MRFLRYFIVYVVYISCLVSSILIQFGDMLQRIFQADLDAVQLTASMGMAVLTESQ